MKNPKNAPPYLASNKGKQKMSTVSRLCAGRGVEDISESCQEWSSDAATRRRVLGGNLCLSHLGA